VLDRDTLLRAIAANGAHNGTPLGWAEHFGREMVADLLRAAIS
jgi:hypothetical protein